MSRRIVLFLISLVLIASACQKNNTVDIKNNEAFFSSQQEAVDRVNKFTKHADAGAQIKSVTNISYVHTPRKSYAFVFYETATGPKNLVIARIYSENGLLKSESVSTCGGNECTCKVQAIIDNQGNVTIGCSCSSCVMISTP